MCTYWEDRSVCTVLEESESGGGGGRTGLAWGRRERKVNLLEKIIISDRCGTDVD
ncbi:hypothetical protein Mapa_008537 [Marchantia paleacea]|nr:hypothetical protein Mapa_008537 [Marchantia paleacea]